MDQESLFSTSESPVAAHHGKRPGDESVEQHYWRQVRPLLLVAIERDEVETFVDVLTFALALIGNGAPQAAGDILGRLGRHIYRLAEQTRAEREAEEARKGGHDPN